MANEPPIHLAAPGHLILRDGWYEFTFPCFPDGYDEHQLVIVPAPSRKRVRLFFGTYTIPCGFTPADRQRLLPKLASITASPFTSTRLFDLPPPEEAAFQFHPELFEDRSHAGDALAKHDLNLFTDFTSIDVVHERYGLEICGIQARESLDQIANILQGVFPHWHYNEICLRDTARDPGWRFRICMLRNPRPCC